MEVNNAQDIIDSRDIIERIEELKSFEGSVELDDIEKEELEVLKALNEAGQENCVDWDYGEALIRDDYFKNYAQSLAEDCGLIDDDIIWPTNCIDWDQAVSELQMDYTTINYDGVEYWIRM